MKKHLFPLFGTILLITLAFSPSALAVDRINVSDYGATPNDGTDDTGPITNAVNSGRSIYFPPGTYNYTGSIVLPANQSYRLYGDGPGVSTIIFNGNPYAGIYGPNMGINELNVEGLTLKANTANAGTGIYVIFGPNYPNSAKVRTAAIHNVQIVGSSRDGTSGGYWGGGIFLWKAQNAVLDKVEINGNKNVTSFGIQWGSDQWGQEGVTGLEMSNLQIKYCDSALRTSGHAEGIYVTGFEFNSCGRNGQPAVDLYTVNGTTVHMVNGRVDSVGSGLTATNYFGVKLSNINFRHNGPELADSTMVYINNSPFDVMITECSFFGVNLNQVQNENGIFLSNAHSVRIAGNNFTNMQPVNGSCIVILSNASVVRVTDNLFSNVRNRYIDQRPPGDVYYLGNN